MNKQIIMAGLAAFFAPSGSISAQPQADTPLWVYDAGSLITSSPTLAPDGTVYLTAGGNLYAITNSGSVASNKWVFASGPSSTPALATDGTIYVAGGNLYAVNPDSSQKWSYSPAGAGCPALGWDNSVYIQDATYLNAISNNGTVAWKAAAGGAGVFPSAAIGADGSIYVASPTPDTLYAFTSQGAQKWAIPAPIADSTAIGADGTIYIAAATDFFSPAVYAVSPNGTVLWTNRNPLGNQCFARSPTIAKDGTIYVLTSFNFTIAYGFGLYAITPAGALKWQLVTNLFGGPCLDVGTPAIDAAGTLYLRAYTSLFAVSPGGVVQWAFNTGEGANDHTSTCPAIGSDGTIYAAFGSKLYAFAGTNKLADSPWPMYRQNARHTGKVEKPALKNPQRRSDANFQFQLYAQLGQTNTVESTTDLSNWNSLTNVVVSAVPMDVIDLTASNFPARFYRTFSP